MAKLQAAIGHADVVFLGRSNPFQYDAGVMGGTAFAAGTSVRCVVGTDALDYQELKVKGADFANVWPTLEGLGRGVVVSIDYRPSQSKEKPAELVGIRLADRKG